MNAQIILLLDSKLNLYSVGGIKEELEENIAVADIPVVND